MANKIHIQDGVRAALEDFVATQVGLRLDHERKENAAKLALERLGQMDLDKVLFTVEIHDSYESMLSVEQRRGPVRITLRGLENTVKAAESNRVYGRTPRTDGALKYYVVAHLGELDLYLPDEVWLPYSVQESNGR